MSDLKKIIAKNYFAHSILKYVLYIFLIKFAEKVG